jgi:hypothetical protein
MVLLKSGWLRTESTRRLKTVFFRDVVSMRGYKKMVERMGGRLSRWRTNAVARAENRVNRSGAIVEML